MRRLHATVPTLVLLIVSQAWAQHASPPTRAATSREALVADLDALATARLATRARAVAALDSREAVEGRRATVRSTIERLIGGFPTDRPPLSARVVGQLAGDGFTVERVVFDSLPNYAVTANVFVPAARSGRVPAVVISPGHSANGKGGDYAFAANVARNGMIALTYDPIGQGERLQAVDPATQASRIGRPTGEHGHASIKSMLMGEHIARYFVWDAIRAIDYLQARDDVDGGRIGAFGCSGGGVVTAMLAAFDVRVVAAAPACYITSFEALLPTAGPQEAEQSIPGFIEAGLDFGDWILLAAPRAYAVVSTTDDMFPFAGARTTVDEARRLYDLLGASDRFRWITGPGGHGALGPVSGEILGFFLTYLKGTDAAPTVVRVTPPRPEDLWATPTGQLQTSLGSETIHSLMRARPPRPDSGPMTDERRAEVARDVRALAGITISAASPAPRAARTSSATRDATRIESFRLTGPTGPELDVVVRTPHAEGRRPLTMLVDAAGDTSAAPVAAEVDRLVGAGHIVVTLATRPSPFGTEEVKAPLLGTAYLLSLRAFLVGRTIVGLRADDILRAVAWVATRHDVDPGRLAVHARGATAVAVLHAAVLEPRIRSVRSEGMLASYRAIIDQELHRDASEVLVPGALAHYDLPDLIAAIAPRRVEIIAPVDAMGTPTAPPRSAIDVRAPGARADEMPRDRSCAPSCQSGNTAARMP